MLKIGLTGNIGSGKSTVAQIFSSLGIPVYHADDESKKFLDSDRVVQKLVSRFGNQILNKNGSVNRKNLAAIVFSNQESLGFLNSILHPMVRIDFINWAARYESFPYVLQEAAIIFESGFASEYDKIIHVSCPKELAIERVMKRDWIDGQTVLNRMHFQMGDEQKAALSDFIIMNTGRELVIPQVLHIHQTLLKIGPECNNDITTGAVDS